MIATLIFVFYPKAQVGASPITTTEEAFYWTFGRIAWPLCLSWIVFACVSGYGGIVNDFLSCPLWQPFAKLSFNMYIWHLLLESYHAGRMKTETNFSNYDFVSGEEGFIRLFTTCIIFI